MASICAFNVFRAESGVPPPVKSWLQTADEKPFYCPPASSISLQRNEMVMAYKAPVVRLNKGLGSIQTSTHKKDSAKYSSMIVDSYNPAIRQSQGSPLKEACETDTLMVWSLTLPTLRNERENENYDLHIQLNCSGLFVCMHVFAYACTSIPIVQSSPLYACFSALLYRRLLSLSFRGSEEKR